MPNIGTIVLFLALLISIFSSVTFIFGIAKKNISAIASATNSVIVVFGLVSMAIFILLYSLLVHNFQLEYVASYSSINTSLPYLISALWAGNKGSLLFWAWLLSLFVILVIFFRRKKYDNYIAPVSLVIIIVETFFLFLLIFLANPFDTLLITPTDGIGMNPMLENPGMIFHPPILLAGYVALTIPFAFVIAALIRNKYDNYVLDNIRTWAFVSWLLLGIGNLIGAWWAYVELGWGGYWAWDPVENAGLMPWLLLTAFLHSFMMQRKKQMFKIWNLLLIILAFCLVIFGTYITRSGILSSVHSFGETAMGPFFVAFLGLLVIGSLMLVYRRYKDLAGKTQIESIISKETSFLMNNILFVSSALAILLGTIFPTISELLTGKTLAVDTSFFNKMVGPIFIAIIFLIGICTLISWRKLSKTNLGKKLVFPSIFAVISLAAPVIMDFTKWYTLFGWFICSFVFFAILYQWCIDIQAHQKTRKENYFKSFFGLMRANNTRYGAYIIHISMVLIAIGVICSSSYSLEKETSISAGNYLTIGDYRIKYNGGESTEDKTKSIQSAKLTIYRADKLSGTLNAKKYFYINYEQPVTEVAILSTLREDIYVILAEINDDGSATLKVLINPMVNWIWIGGFVFLIGGIIAFYVPQRRLLLETI